MTSKERVKIAMELGTADRVPLMCQLSLGHYFLHSGIDPVEIWFTSDGFSEALHTMAERYKFDGILVNLPGRERDYTSQIKKIERGEEEIRINWRNGHYTVLPRDDNPHYYNASGDRSFPQFEEIDPEKLFYVEPWDITEVSHPYTWGFSEQVAQRDGFFPEYHLDNIKDTIRKNKNNLSIHSEVFSPWSQFLELLNYESALIAILDDPGKVRACLERLTEGTIELAKSQAECGVDAILISSAFAGAGLISREHYIDFVLPYEKRIIDSLHQSTDVPVYTHTCGSIGDRLDLMLETGTDGIDTLDPPPLGTVELPEAKETLRNRAFIKGNIDPVNTLLMGNREQIIYDIRWRLEIGKPGGGYILSSACSIAPGTPTENIELLTYIIETEGKY